MQRGTDRSGPFRRCREDELGPTYQTDGGVGAAVERLVGLAFDRYRLNEEFERS